MRVESSLAALQSAHQAELCARQELLAELEEQREVRMASRFDFARLDMCVADICNSVSPSQN